MKGTLTLHDVCLLGDSMRCYKLVDSLTNSNADNNEEYCFNVIESLMVSSHRRMACYHTLVVGPQHGVHGAHVRLRRKWTDGPRVS